MNEIDDDLNKTQVDYKEIVKISQKIKILIISVICLSIALTLIFSIHYPAIDFLLIIIFFIADTTIIFLYLNYRKLIISIDKERIKLEFGLFNTKIIPIHLIQNFKIINPKFLSFGGVGVRFGLDGSWAYLTDFKEAMKIIYKEHRTFVFSTRKSEKLSDLLKERIEK